MRWVAALADYPEVAATQCHQINEWDVGKRVEGAIALVIAPHGPAERVTWRCCQLACVLLAGIRVHGSLCWPYSDSMGIVGQYARIAVRIASAGKPGDPSGQR